MNAKDEDESREKEIKRRAGAGQANLPFTRPDEKVVEMISTGDALYIISNYGIFRVYTPDNIDPDVVGRNIPWVVTRIFAYGSRENAVARTLIQTVRANGKLVIREQNQQALAQIGVRVSSILLECQASYDTISKSIEDVIAEVQKNYDSLKAGPGTIVLPHLHNFDGLIKSFFGSAKRCVTEIVQILQEAFEIKKIERGNYTKTINGFDPKSDIEKQIKEGLLKLDDNVKYILECRNAIEHPKNNYGFFTQDFSLGTDRKIYRPSWKLIHHKYGEDAWFDFIENGKEILKNLVLLAEATIILSSISKADGSFEVVMRRLSKEERNPDAPCHFDFSVVIGRK